jgi:hypothetical protein
VSSRQQAQLYESAGRLWRILRRALLRLLWPLRVLTATGRRAAEEAEQDRLVGHLIPLRGSMAEHAVGTPERRESIKDSFYELCRWAAVARINARRRTLRLAVGENVTSLLVFGCCLVWTLRADLTVAAGCVGGLFPLALVRNSLSRFEPLTGRIAAAALALVAAIGVAWMAGGSAHELIPVVQTAATAPGGALDGVVIGVVACAGLAVVHVLIGVACAWWPRSDRDPQRPEVSAFRPLLDAAVALNSSTLDLDDRDRLNRHLAAAAAKVRQSEYVPSWLPAKLRDHVDKLSETTQRRDVELLVLCLELLIALCTTYFGELRPDRGTGGEAGPGDR